MLSFFHFPFLYLFKGQEMPKKSQWEGKVKVVAESVSESRQAAWLSSLKSLQKSLRPFQACSLDPTVGWGN